jgi:signal transduction histidine kinase/CheY-like chemotaxis protein
MDEDLRLAIDHLHEGVQVIGFDWRYVYLNDTAAAHGRRPAADLVGRRMQDCYPGIEDTEVYRALVEVMRDRRPRSLRHEFHYPDGDRRWFDLRIEPVPAGVCVLSMDITADQERQQQLRSVEEQLQRAQKLEAIGRLAGGIAHDFNNQLTVILGFAQMLLENEADPAAARDLHEIEAAAHRSAALTRQLLAFSKRQVLRAEPVYLPDVVRGVTRLLERLLGEDMRCEVRINPATELILADSGQLENVLTNLAVNARDAMPSGGVLTLTTSTTEITEEDARQHTGMKSGRYTVLAVSDNGCGMDAETQRRIFEPFFTTKEAGKGTGLGLAMVYGIVKQMSGFIWVYSEVGRGTTFRLYFPVAADQPRADIAAAVTDVETRGVGRILLVEDDAGVREFVVRSLQAHGYEVVAVSSAEDARKRLVRATPLFDLLLSDVVLPGQSGPALFDEIRSRASRVVFMSGYSNVHVQNPALAEEYPLIEKPFTARELLKAVRDALAGPVY